MNLEDIYRFFQNPPPIYLSKEQAACYVLSILLRGDSYGTELIKLLEREYPGYCLSDTVLYGALRFLESEGTIVGYWKKVEGRGRPRRMYKVRVEAISQVRELAHLWQQYLQDMASQLRLLSMSQETFGNQ